MPRTPGPTPQPGSPVDDGVLTRHDVAGARAVVLMLHGGKPSSRQPVDARSASWKRLASMQGAITPGLHEAGVSTRLLRYAVRGWNGGAPVADARRAVEVTRAETGDLPVILLGHSMGARAAAHVADTAGVVGVVALAPWWQSDDPAYRLRGLPVHAAHGRTDKITSARQTRAFLRRAEEAGARTEFRDMGRIGHYMLRRVEEWNAFATSRVLSVLEG